jgi:hypothetical protein
VVAEAWYKEEILAMLCSAGSPSLGLITESSSHWQLKSRFFRSLLVWERDQYANHWLDDASQAKLNRIVVEEARKTWEFRLKIIGGIVGALTGLAGTLIGLIAIWRKK